MKLYQSSAKKIFAVLGPTNTGKTHLALERMLGRSSGVMGFPLRLLARENYDKAVRLRGVENVALVTGEEKIVPPRARYFFCTVEAMPLDMPVAFVGVDEIQLCADPERGHVFTDRLLNARGVEETMFMGSDVVEPLLRRLVPDVKMDKRSRFSKLSYSGRKKINRLPPKSAIAAFSVDEVYSIAELVRRQKGGAAVVLGALSPRTRNAQVGLYQAGEVECIVATDAIGMGLNLDVNHVAFAGLRKFDGRKIRRLTVPEIAQIAGRAGRYMNDGTFGITADAQEIDPIAVERLEAHDFMPHRRIFWRNSDLCFESVEALISSLKKKPPSPELIRIRPSDDERALEFLCSDVEIKDMARTPSSVRLLWEVCGIPDFGKTMTDAHPRLLGQIFRFLAAADSRLPTDWFSSQIRRLDRTDGDIDTLSRRIAGIRTWAYIAHRSDWLCDPPHWRKVASTVEDKLSDAMHERLVNRFLDRRTSVLVKRLKDQSSRIDAHVGKAGEVSVEGHCIGRLDGFRFTPGETREKRAAKAVNAAAARALREEMAQRIKALAEAPDDSFFIGPKGQISWDKAPVAALSPGRSVLYPKIYLPAYDLLEPSQRKQISERLSKWVALRKRTLIGPLLRLETASDLTGTARGVAFQLVENLGSMPRNIVGQQIKALTQEDRRRLRRLGVCFGRTSVYIPALLKPASSNFCAMLWAVINAVETVPACPEPGRISLEIEPGAPKEFYEAAGYRVCGSLAVRFDMLERLAALAWELSQKGSFEIDATATSLLGQSTENIARVLFFLGYATKRKQNGVIEAARQKHTALKQQGRSSPRSRAVSPHNRLRAGASSPFAKLGRSKSEI